MISINLGILAWADYVQEAVSHVTISKVTCNCNPNTFLSNAVMFNGKSTLLQLMMLSCSFSVNLLLSGTAQMASNLRRAFG